MNEWAVSSESSVRAGRAAARAAGWRPYVLDGKGEGKPLARSQSMHSFLDEKKTKKGAR